MATHRFSIDEAVRRGMESFRRLEAKGHLRLYDGGREYEMTAAGKARVSELIGHPCGPIHVSRVPDLVAAVDRWLRLHDGEDTSDDRTLVTAAALLMEKNGYVRLTFGDWRY